MRDSPRFLLHCGSLSIATVVHCSIGCGVSVKSRFVRGQRACLRSWLAASKDLCGIPRSADQTCRHERPARRDSRRSPGRKAGNSHSYGSFDIRGKHERRQEANGFGCDRIVKRRMLPDHNLFLCVPGGSWRNGWMDRCCRARPFSLPAVLRCFHGIGCTGRSGQWTLAGDSARSPFQNLHVNQIPAALCPGGPVR